MHRLIVLLLAATAIHCVDAGPTNEELSRWVKDGTLTKGSESSPVAEKPTSATVVQKKPVAHMDSHDWRSVKLLAYMAFSAASAVASGSSLLKAWRRRGLLTQISNNEKRTTKRD